MTTSVKIAPHSKEAEMMVLGCMLVDERALKIGMHDLDISDFFLNEHQSLFQTFKKLNSDGRRVDIHLLSEELKKQGKLEDVGGIGYLVTLAQYAGTSTYIEEYIEVLRDKSILRRMISHSQQITNKALDETENPARLLKEFQSELRSFENSYIRKIPINSLEEKLNQLNENLALYRGKTYLGLRVKTIDEFNDKLLGLRKLNLLAAAPNVGKTALTIQIALETLMVEKDACLAYFSLEMTSSEIFTRMMLFLTELNFQTFVFGSQNNNRDEDPNAYFTTQELKQIEQAKKTLLGIGNRIQIVDLSMCPSIDANSIINYVEKLKNNTKSKRAMVIIDYLQVWPIPSNAKFPSENEADKWRIGEMKKIRDAMNDDPVIVISEARKPSGKDDTWGGDLSDVMGSARGTYTPDVVMLLSQLKPKNLVKWWVKNNLPKLETSEEFEGEKDEKEGLTIKNFLANLGISLCRLDIPKARDGMQKFSLLLEFHFHKNTFKKFDANNIRKLIEKQEVRKTTTLNFS